MLVMAVVAANAVEEANFKSLLHTNIDKHSAVLQKAGLDANEMKNMTGLILEEAEEAFDMFVKIFRTEGESGERIYSKLDAEYNKRKNNFVQMFEMIAKNNIANTGFKMGINQFSDVGAEEAKEMTGLTSVGDGLAESDEELCKRMPTTCNDHRRRLNDRWENSLDWSTSNNPAGRNVLTGVVNQGKCNNCWAVAATETMEARYALDHRTDPPILGIAEVLISG
jgi:hypothetical protein